MWWLYIILISYLILSLSNIVDKIFLSKLVTDSIVYALWVSILSVIVVAVYALHGVINPAIYDPTSPIGPLTVMSPFYLVLAIGIGILFTFSIYLLYTALQKGEASRVIPMIGGSMPILIYAMTFSHDYLDSNKTIAFILLVAGTILISLMPKGARKKKRNYDSLLALAASFSFALFFVLTQFLFSEQGFVNGIVWPRLGSGFAVIFLLAFPRVRRLMADSLKPLSGHVRALWLSSQGLGALGFLGQQYVISIPHVSVALVSALQAVQYVFILIFAVLMSRFRPSLLRESMSIGIVAQKIAALCIIGIGLYFIAL